MKWFDCFCSSLLPDRKIWMENFKSRLIVLNTEEPVYPASIFPKFFSHMLLLGGKIATISYLSTYEGYLWLLQAVNGNKPVKETKGTNGLR